MHPLEPTLPVARRELVLVATLLVGLCAFVQPDAAFVLAGLLPVTVLLAGLGVLRVAGAPPRPYAALLLPAVLTGSAAAAIHMVPAGPWLLVAIPAFAAVLDRIVELEARIAVQASGASEAERSQALVAAVGTAFVAFIGVAALVPGGMPEPAGSPVVGTSTMTQGWLAVLALGDAIVALAIGWRLSVLRSGAAPGIARSALTYALVTAVSAGLIRAIDLPRLVGPAILTLVFYLWDAQHAAAPTRRQERRFAFEMLLLAGLAVLVVTWNAWVPS